jgi:glycosyltransferase involved in cell wall biosynthesis
LKAQKNHALLLRSFARMQRGDEQLLILGEGPLRSDLERLATDLGIADRVAMPGFKVDPWPYLASAELFALSSDYEGYPLALAEAMHAGLKIVSTDCVSGPSEMLDRGRFGSLVPVGDEQALAAAMEEGLRLPHSAKLVRERAETVSGAGIVDRYLDLLIGSQ